MKLKKNLLNKILYNNFWYIVLVLLILSVLKISFFAAVCLAQHENPQGDIKKAKEYYGEKKWKQAAWHYNKYFKYVTQADASYIESLSILAEIYYLHLKRYVPALEIYSELDSIVSDKNIKNRILQLNRDIDNDGFIYAQEHDLGLSDRVPILNEVDKLVPPNCSVTYIKKGGLGGGIMRSFRFSKNNKEVYIYNDKEEKIGELTLNNFLKIWVTLVLLEPEDIPEENAIYYNIDNKQTLFTSRPSIVIDGSQVEIMLVSNEKIVKMLIINPVELCSEKLYKIVNSLRM
jgi:hypothetical protein